MALTLVEAAKLSTDVLQRGVIELIVKDDPILEKLIFKDIKGNGLTYNVETTMSTASFYDVGDTWTESTSVVTPATAVTKILGGDADVDNFLKATRSNENDLMGEQIAAKTKAIRAEFNLTALYGYATTETKRFDGLHYLIRSATYNTVAVGASGTPAALSLAKLEEAVDMIKNGKPDMILMTKLMRRSINKYMNGVGGITKVELQGKTVQTLFDIPIAVSDYLSDLETCSLQYGTLYGHQPSGGTAIGVSVAGTTMFVLQFAPQAFCGIQSMGITTEKFAKLETKDASRVRIKWYPSIMLQSIISCSKVTGVAPAGTVTA